MIERGLRAGVLALMGGVVITSARAEDARQLVEMPAGAVALIRDDMRAHLLALVEVSALLADGKSAEAAAAVRKNLGSGSMGRFRGNPDAPGRHMPVEMHRVGMSLHQAADAWADAIDGGDQKKINVAQQDVLSSCAACHMAYRVR